MRRLAAECFGTFCLVFAIVVNDVSGGVVTYVGVAVTVGFFAARRFEARMVVPYVACRCLGAVLASGLLRGMFPARPTLGATLPSGAFA